MTEREETEKRLVGVVLNVAKDDAALVVRLVHAACSRMGLPEPIIMASSAGDPGHIMTRRCVDAGCTTVIAAGGDGTVRAVATELIGTDIALGIIPLGTGNLFARNIGLPHHDLLLCAEGAVHGDPQLVDTLALSLERADGQEDTEVSLVIAGGGLDAEVMADTREVLKQRAGWLAYGEAGLRHVAGARKAVTVELDDGTTADFRVRSVLLANCGTLQAGLQLAPSARFDDGKLDIVLFTPRHALDWAKIVTKTVLRTHMEVPVITVKQSPSTRLSMAEPMPFQVDGDPVGEVTSVHAEVVPDSLIVRGVVPPLLEDPTPDPPVADITED
ncbi:hypothetical protein HGQ17_06835 [Nesterenkonia sp. MY13]|uniref:DAGKc domain-containing protein n=1 Tax=Nesterenkonia sedimenti TaxID=1463632 RepID=A0A7X8TJ39_9MICC|nr:diacylglycerol kinase family protein [Nesterenkonia sedimenti]NLS09725.1 hypothetical protein [Nesterenkonia sedimenti]